MRKIAFYLCVAVLFVAVYVAAYVLGGFITQELALDARIRLLVALAQGATLVLFGLAVRLIYKRLFPHK